jgi:hypothetical protein
MISTEGTATNEDFDNLIDKIVSPRRKPTASRQKHGGIDLVDLTFEQDEKG